MASLVLNGNTSGSVTISSPAVSGTTTLTLPATTDTLVGKTTTDTLTNKTLTNPSFNSAQLATVSGTAPLYMCRAWVNFNGTGTVAIRGSGNVASITDNGTGDYTVNFTTAMTDVNYATFGSGVTGTNDDDTGRYFLGVKGTSTTTTSSVRVVNVWAGDGGTLGDKAIATISIFR